MNGMTCLLLVMVAQVPDIQLPFPPADAAKPASASCKKNDAVFLTPASLDAPTEAERQTVAQTIQELRNNHLAGVAKQYQKELARINTLIGDALAKEYAIINSGKNVGCAPCRVKLLLVHHQDLLKAAAKKYTSLYHSGPVVSESLYPIQPGQVGLKLPKQANLHVRIPVGVGIVKPVFVCSGVREMDGKQVFVIDVIDWHALLPDGVRSVAIAAATKEIDKSKKGVFGQ